MAEGVFEVDLKDAGGVPMSNIVDVDGMRLSRAIKPGSDVVSIFRNVKHVHIRDDDVMLCTPPKSGTHWGYEIISMLLQGKAESIPVPKTATMLALTTDEDLEKMSSPRVLNTHFPYRCMPQQMIDKKTKIVLILRNPKDAAVSQYHHMKAIRALNYNGRFEDYLPLFMEGKLLFNSWFDYVLEFEEAMATGDMSIHLTFFEDLKENGLEEIKKVATFLSVDADDELCKAIHEKCQFKNMADKANNIEKPHLNSEFSIFRKGEIGDWKNYFTVAQSEVFDALYEDKMKTSNFKFQFEPSCSQ